MEKGRELINKGDLAAAMKRFNQAWLLTPDNAEVFRGFGVVLGAKRQFDEALKMFKKAVELDPRKAPLKADFANIYVGKAYFANGIERRRFIKEALALYSEANALDPKAGDVLIKWAIALYYAGSFRESWDKVHEAQKTGIKVEERFLRDLNRKFPEATAAQIEK